MSNIVDRLRDRECKFCDEAIVEIERLRRDNAKVVEAMQSAPRPPSDATAAWLLSYIDWFFKTRDAALRAATEGEPTAP